MKRAVRTLIRLVASAVIIFGVLEVGLELTRHQMRKVEISPWHCAIGAVLVICGAILFAVSARLAEQWADDFE